MTKQKIGEFTAETLAADIDGLRDDAVKLSGSTFDHFAKTAWFVTAVLNDPNLLLEIIKIARANEIKVPLAASETAGDAMDDGQKAQLAKQKSKGKVENLHLFVFRAIFRDQDGTFRSFENQAYPAREASELVHANKINTVEDLAAAVKAYEFTEGKKTYKGIEALRLKDRSRHSKGPRESSTKKEISIPSKAAQALPFGVIEETQASNIKFIDGWALVVLREDGTKAKLMFDANVEGDQLKAIVSKAFEHAEAANPGRFKAVELPARQAKAKKKTAA